MSGKVFMVTGKEKYAVSSEKADSLIPKNPIISKKLALSATGTTQMVTVPAGAYVYRVGAMAVSAVSNVAFDVGDGNVTDRYLDGITTITANDIKMSGLGGAVGADPVGGHYYASEDTIDVTVGTATSTGGTIRLLVWYSIYDGDLPS